MQKSSEIIYGQPQIFSPVHTPLNWQIPSHDPFSESFFTCYSYSSSSSKNKDPFDVGHCADYLSPLPPFPEPEERGDPEEGEDDIFDNEDPFDVPTLPQRPAGKPARRKSLKKPRKNPRKKS